MNVADRRQYPILIVDDDPDLVATFRFNFEEDFTVLGATSGREALEIMERQPIAILVADQRMPDLHGVEVIRRALELRPSLVPIVLTGFTDYQALVRAINLGRIYRYLAKPWNFDELHLTLTTAVESCHLMAENARLTAELAVANERLASENTYLKQRDPGRAELDGIVGDGPAMSRVRHLVKRVRDTDTTVLIEGPTGTGKELIARAIHYGGPRRDRLFVPVNCGSMPDTLLQSELFGHRRGAFTGATSDRRGLFKIAEGGTIFLDEIGEAGPAFQNALLRVLELHRIRPLGQDSDESATDVRVVTATNRQLDREVAEGRFREDLMYRLRVFTIRMPSLDQRREDIPSLVQHFLRKYAVALKRPVPTLSPEAFHELQAREYRGNVRELANLIEHAMVMSEPGEPIGLEHLFDAPMLPVGGNMASTRLDVVVAECERKHIAAIVAKHGGRRKPAADELGMTTAWLRKKMIKLGMVDDDSDDDGST